MLQCSSPGQLRGLSIPVALTRAAARAGGICGACVARVAGGAVDMSDIDDLSFTLDDDQVTAGMALLCMARPASDVTLETQCDWGLSLGIREWEGASGKLVGGVQPLMGKKWADMTAAERAEAEAADATATQPR
jgi:2Fe-2S iron-sulfur cluster binding domain